MSPQSYTPKSPVVMRAISVKYDAYKQVKNRLKAFKAMNHPTDKIELIIMGGTFLEYPEKFQNEFIKSCYEGLNNEKSIRDDSGEPSNSLIESQKKNELGKHRCVALCIETRPDVYSEHIKKMRKWGVTRVELGVQIIDNKIYKKVKRGHTVQDVVDATKKLRDAGFKIGYHIMPGLPGSNIKKDLRLFKKLFSDQKFKPDQLKIYPCQVMPGSKLEKMYWKKKYIPYHREKIEKVLIQMLKLIPRYCRVMRIMREIPPEYLVAGTIRIDLRKEIENNLRNKNSKLKEIRYREIGFALRDKREVNLDLDLKITKYKAAKGDEYFLEIVNKDDILFGLLRLRIFDSPFAKPLTLIHNLHSQTHNIDINLLMKKSTRLHKNKNSVDSSKKSRAKRGKLAIVRELHVYGQALKLGEKGKLGQHTGIGKWLMDEAEKITKKNKIKKLSVTSGIGAREYYRKLDYNIKENYMVKNIKI